MIMQRINVKFPMAPILLPIALNNIRIVDHDCANFRTLSYKKDHRGEIFSRRERRKAIDCRFGPWMEYKDIVNSQWFTCTQNVTICENFCISEILTDILVFTVACCLTIILNFLCAWWKFGVHTIQFLLPLSFSWIPKKSAKFCFENFHVQLTAGPAAAAILFKISCKTKPEKINYSGCCSCRDPTQRFSSNSWKLLLVTK